jgi:tryptophanyl-tRNA synthetase
MFGEKIVLSGIRPTAGLHLGNILGAVENMVKLQNSGEYECYYFIADYHAATTNPAFGTIRENSLAVLADMIACGLDPEKSVIFRQSDIPELPQLHLIFSYLITVSELERNPVYKEQKQELHLNGNGLSSFLLYPVLQAADICLYKGAFIPVGKDQVPHIEITREIARRANTLCNREIFPVPEAMLTEVPKIPGIDGRKMSKSYDNFIALSDSSDETRNKVFHMVTDVKKPRLSDPGHPDECNLFQLMKCYENVNTIVQIKKDCKEGKIGCRKVCKPHLSQVLNDAMREPRRIRNELINDNNGLENVLKKGTEKSRNKAIETIKEVRTALGFSVQLEEYCQELV